MEIGIDDLDEYVNEESEIDNTTTLDNTENQEIERNEDEIGEDLIKELLKSKGIEDSSKIKFENDEGEIEEVDWDSLSNEDKLNILNTEATYSPEDELDDSEIELINAIRNSKMSPAEYVNYIQNQGIQNYLQNANPVQMEHSVDNLSDDDLFVADLLTRIGEENISDEEIQSMLEAAKQNEALFEKQISAIRNEYKQLEDNNLYQQQVIQRNQQIESYNRFAESVENEIRSFTDINGFELDMDESEMEELYDFITGFDGAGVSVFGKALNDPETLVKMAWFALNGDQAMQDINDYWTKEISNVRKNSYKQGVEDARNGKVKLNSNVEIRKSSKKSRSIDDLDDF